MRRLRSAAALAALALAGCDPPPAHPALAELCASGDRFRVLRAERFDTLFVQAPYLPSSYPDAYDRELGHQPCFGCVELLLDRGLTAVEFRLADKGGFAWPDPEMVGRHFLAPAGDPRCGWWQRFARNLPMLMGRGRLRRAGARVPAGQCVALETARRSADFSLTHESEQAVGEPAYIWRETHLLADRRTGEALATATTFAQSGGDFADRLCDGLTSDSWRRAALDLVFQARR